MRQLLSSGVWSLPWRGRWSARSAARGSWSKELPHWCVDTRSGDRPDRLRSEDGEGVDRATTPVPAPAYAPPPRPEPYVASAPDAEVRLEAQAGAR